MKRWIVQAGILIAVFAPGCNREQQVPPALDTTVTLDTTFDPSEPAAQPATEQSPFDRDAEIDAALNFSKQNDYQRAIASLQRVLLNDPGDVETLFRLARIHASRGDFLNAVSVLEDVPEDHPEAGLPALGQAADWYMQLQRFGEAETRYKKIVERVPDAAVAHRQLAFLYNRQGRRHEAVTHIRTLCRLGDVTQDELHALMVVTNAIFDDPSVPSGESNSRRYLPIGPAAQARVFYTANRYAEAVDALLESVASEDRLPSNMALFGRLAIESQNEDRFWWWLASIDDSVKEYSDYWAAIGIFLLGKHRYEEAIRAFAEALDRDPTDILSIRRINQALTAVGDSEEAERWMDRYVLLREVTLASNRLGKSKEPNLESFETIADGLDKLHRPLEAATWRLLEAFYRKAPREEVAKLNEPRLELGESADAFPSQSERLCGLALAKYPMPELEIPAQAIASLPGTFQLEISISDRASFENMASRIGLDHTYQVASKPQPFQFALYQSLGGGVAVLDYDLDGLVDLYFAQGGGDPPEMLAKISNLFYRSTGDAVVDVTDQSGTRDCMYSIGVTAGDWNQDGFADLVITNIGNKVLLTNNGDGTYHRRQFDVDANYEVLASSVAMGDVTGDGLPDIFSLHYVEDEAMIERPGIDEDGNVLVVSPLSFVPGIDRVAINDGGGGMVIKKVNESATAPSTGLGVVIADWDDAPGNEIFVGNDIRPNHLWARSPTEESWADTATLTGCAYGHGGASTASMGIAVGDFDGTGTQDIHVTNFYLEPVSLFMNRGGTFEDRCIQYKLDRDSSSVLGFGCQAIDYNNDGRPDLAVTNGNIEKAPGEPLHHPPQLFANLGTEFRLAEVDDPSDYWSGKYLGRGMARLDFNRDGKSDLLITHMGSPSALLVNQTETENHWLNFQLVGTQSERDAIGAQVEVHAGDKVWTNWIVGGDGYLCRNEATVSFGLSNVTRIDQVVVRWPTGNKQSFDNIAVDQRVLLIENDSEAFTQQK